MGSSSPNRVENTKYMKPPTRYYTSHSITNPNFMHYYLRKNPSKLRYTCCLFDPLNMDIILRPTKWKPPSSKGGPLPRLIERCETNGTLIFLQCWKKVFIADVSSGTQTQHQRNTLKKNLAKMVIKNPSPWRKIWNHRPTSSVQALNRCFFEDFLVEKPCHV